MNDGRVSKDYGVHHSDTVWTTSSLVVLGQCLLPEKEPAFDMRHGEPQSTAIFWPSCLDRRKPRAHSTKALQTASCKGPLSMAVCLKSKPRTLGSIWGDWLEPQKTKTLKDGHGLNVSHHTIVGFLEDWQWQNQPSDQSQVGSKEGSRRANYPIPPRGGSDNKP
jgi:hypothetical protein